MRHAINFGVKLLTPKFMTAMSMTKAGGLVIEQSGLIDWRLGA